MISFQYILGLSLGLLSQKKRFRTFKVSDKQDNVRPKPQKGTLTTEIGTPRYFTNIIFLVSKYRLMFI